MRCALAANIASLAETSKRFLETAQWMRLVSLRREPSCGNPPTNSAASSPAATTGSTAVVTVTGKAMRLGVAPGAVAASTGVGAPAAAPAACGNGPLEGEAGEASVASTQSFDAELSALREEVSGVVLSLVTIDDSAVKRCLLADLTRLAIFMSRQATNDVLLPHLMTVLNNRDASLSIAFFEAIPGVCAFVGRMSFLGFVLPCILYALVDVEETVVAAALQSLCRLADVGLLTKASLTEIANSGRESLTEIAHKIAPLLAHPTSWVHMHMHTL